MGSLPTHEKLEHSQILIESSVDVQVHIMSYIFARMPRSLLIKRQENDYSHLIDALVGIGNRIGWNYAQPASQALRKYADNVTSLGAQKVATRFPMFKGIAQSVVETVGRQGTNYFLNYTDNVISGYLLAYKNKYP